MRLIYLRHHRRRTIVLRIFGGGRVWLGELEVNHKP